MATLKRRADAIAAEFDAWWDADDHEHGIAYGAMRAAFAAGAAAQKARIAALARERAIEARGWDGEEGIEWFADLLDGDGVAEGRET